MLKAAAGRAAARRRTRASSRRHKYKADIGSLIEGKGVRGAGKVPKAFWDLLRKAAELKRAEWRRGDPPTGEPPPRPTVQILTNDPHVPWEIALMAVPLIADGEPGFPGAQACVARWILVPETDLSDLRPADTHASDAAIVTAPTTPRYPRRPRRPSTCSPPTRRGGSRRGSPS